MWEQETNEILTRVIVAIDVPLPARKSKANLVQTIKNWIAEGFSGEEVLEYVTTVKSDIELEKEAVKEAKLQTRQDEKEAKLREAERKHELELKRLEEVKFEKERDAKLQHELELKRLEESKLEKERERQHELELKRLELGLAAGNVNVDQTHNVTSSSSSDKVKFDMRSYSQPYKDGENILLFLNTFVRICEQMKFEENTYSVRIMSLLSGSAREVVGRLSNDDFKDFSKVKQALLQRYQMTAETLHTKFRTLDKKDNQAYTDFAYRLKTFAREWVSAENCVGNFEGLFELICVEQFLTKVSSDLKMYLIDKGDLKTIEKVAQLSDDFVARRQAVKVQSESKPKVGENVNNDKNSVNNSNGSNRGYGGAYSKFGFNKGYGGANKGTGNGSSNGNSGNSGNTANNSNSQVNSQNNESQSANSSNKSVSNGQGQNRYFDRRTNFKQGCFQCGNLEHKKRDCPELKEAASNRCALVNKQISQSRHIYNAKLNGENVKMFKDPGSDVDLVSSRKVASKDLIPGKLCRLRNIVMEGIVELPMTKVSIETPWGTAQVEAAVSPFLPLDYDLVLGDETFECLEKGETIKPLNCNVLTRSQAKKVEGAEVNEELGQSNGDIKDNLQKDVGLNRGKETAKVDLGYKTGVGNSDQADSGIKNVAQPDAKKQKTANKNEKGMKAGNAKQMGGSIVTPLTVDFNVLLNTTTDDLVNEQQLDVSLDGCRKAAQCKTQDNTSEFYFKDKLLHRKWRNEKKDDVVSQVVIPKRFRDKIVSVAHANPWQGHFSKRITKDRVMQVFYWPGLCKDVDDFVKTCETCQKLGKGERAPKAEMVEVPIVEEPFSRIILDVVGPMPQTRTGFKYILTAICAATKYPEAMPMVAANSETIVDELLRLFSRVGFPLVIQTDMGTVFVSQLTSTFLHNCGIEIVHSSPYRPQSNGGIERMHRTLKQVLRAICQENPTDWDKALPPAIFALRTCTHTTTNFAPAELLYGRNLRGPLDILRRKWDDTQVHPTVIQHVVEMLNKFHVNRQLATEAATDARSRSKEFFDRDARTREYEKGDKVLLLKHDRKNKMDVFWSGPYKVLEKLNEVNYRIAKGKGGSKSVIYHVNLLKPFYDKVKTVNVTREVETVGGNAAENDELDGIEWYAWEGGTESVLTPDDVIEMACGIGDLSESRIKELKEVYARVPGVFAVRPGLTNLIEFDVEIVGEADIMSRLPRYSPSQKQLIEEQVNKLLEWGVLVRSDSFQGSPLMVVQQEGKGPRVVADYRNLNKKTKLLRYPIPSIEELVEKVSMAEIISVYDFVKGYFQMKATDRARKVTAVVTHMGIFEFTVMPMGVVNGSFYFQRLMDKICEGLEGFAGPFQDDVAIRSVASEGKTAWENHLEHTYMFLKRVKDAGLTINPSKCQLGMKKVKYLGHMVGGGFRSPSEVKVLAVEKLKRPSTKKGIKQFLGLIGYYQQYIDNYAEKARPLTSLLGKKFPNNVPWSDACENAYHVLKDSLTKHPVLHGPDFSREFILTTDASDFGLGSVLSQIFDNEEEHPILYLSRKLRPAELKYSVIEKECLCIVWSVSKLKPYLTGCTFRLVTDHKPLLYLERAKDTNARLLRWSIALQGFSFTIEHKKGSTNANADALSRLE